MRSISLRGRPMRKFGVKNLTRAGNFFYLEKSLTITMCKEFRAPTDSYTILLDLNTFLVTVQQQLEMIMSTYYANNQKYKQYFRSYLKYVRLLSYNLSLVPAHSTRILTHPYTKRNIECSKQYYSTPKLSVGLPL
mgnify:CR=1 FL=1